MRGPLVSVLMVSHRPLITLAATLKSLAAQMLGDGFEVVVIRPDSSPLLAQHPQFRVITLHTELYSLGELRNIACREARGSILVTQDDDDVSAPTRLERIVAALENADLCGSSLVRFKEPATKRQWTWNGSLLHGHSPEHPWLYGATLAYRRSLWERHNFDPWQHVGEDSKWLQSIRDFRAVDFRDPDMSTHYIGGDNCGSKRPTPPCWTEEPWAE